jgi:hypothetical protein
MHNKDDHAPRRVAAPEPYAAPHPEPDDTGPMVSVRTVTDPETGRILYLEWELGPDPDTKEMVPYLTFPGDNPDEPDRLMVIKDYGDEVGTGLPIRRVIIYGKRADAYATDPVERFVFQPARGGRPSELLERTTIAEHTNLDYWGIEPPDRGKILS